METLRAIRQAEVSAALTMIERTEQRFGLRPKLLAADTAYGSAPMLNRHRGKRHGPHIAGVLKTSDTIVKMSRGSNGVRQPTAEAAC